MRIVRLTEEQARRVRAASVMAVRAETRTKAMRLERIAEAMSDAIEEEAQALADLGVSYEERS